VNERRVLGVLVEKAKTTPDAYPLSLNALTTGSNQKSNRDPILDLTDLDVEEALTACGKNQLAFKITGGRVERWKHNLYDTWKVDKVELAVLGELLLRGAQTEGELRGRASRMEPIADLETLRTVLKALASRGLVVYLTPEGRRGTTVTHGFHSPGELQRLRSSHPLEDAEPPGAVHAAAPAAETAARPALLETQVNTMQTEITALRAQVAQLHNTVIALESELRTLKGALGA
jgi:uncharacterized protein YceH (UPF0502 family)